MPHARVVIDRASGDVVVWAQDLGEDGTVVEEYDDTPDDFGRVAAQTARQVIAQRLRDADRGPATSASSPARRATSSPASSRPTPRPASAASCIVDIGKLEAVLPMAEQVPGEDYEHGTRLKFLVVGVARGGARPVGDGEPHPPGPGHQAVRARGAGTGGRQHRDHRRGPRGGAPQQDRRAQPSRGTRCQGRVHRPDGPAGAQRGRRTGRREDRHHRLGGGPGRRSSATRCRPPAPSGPGSSTRRPRPSGSSCRTTSSRWRSAARARTPGSPRGSPAGASTSTPTPRTRRR